MSITGGIKMVLWILLHILDLCKSRVTDFIVKNLWHVGELQGMCRYIFFHMRCV